jgi:hypothetical protein
MTRKRVPILKQKEAEKEAQSKRILQYKERKMVLQK